jgi:hypothetical protein
LPLLFAASGSATVTKRNPLSTTKHTFGSHRLQHQVIIEDNAIPHPADQQNRRYRTLAQQVRKPRHVVFAPLPDEDAVSHLFFGRLGTAASLKQENLSILQPGRVYKYINTPLKARQPNYQYNDS